MNLVILKIVRFFHLIDKEKYNQLRQIGFIKKSELFDATYYFKQNPQLKSANLDPIKHYVEFGWKIGYNPNEYFDNDSYLIQYPELYEKNLSPLFHYIRENPYILPKFTFRKYFIKLKKKFLSHSNKEPELNDIIARSKYFNEKWYLKQHPELVQKDVNPLEYYLTKGWKEHHNPSPYFNTDFYISTYQDVKKAGVCPLLHYILHGQKEKRLPKAPKNSFWTRVKLAGKSDEYCILYKSGLFDEKWYVKQYPEVKNSGFEPLQHYMEIGWKKGYNPSKYFDTKFYINNHEDVLKSGVNPFRHYIFHGKKEGRKCLPPYKKIENNFMTTTDDQKNPKITVLVASYNYEQFIGKTLDSIMAQTYKNFEVIVVDDGSKDNSVNLIKKYVKKYPNVFLHRHHQGKNKGLVATIKLGLEKATGKYIAFCESDDYWLPTNLEEKVKVINEYGSPKIIYNNVKLFGTGSKRQEEYIANLSLVSEGLYDVDPINQTYNIIPTFSCIMIDKEVLKKVNFDAYLPAWVDWWIYRQIMAKYPIYHVNKVLTMWRIHESYNSEEKALKYMEQYDEFVFYNNELVTEQNKKLINTIYKDNHVKLVKKSGLFDEKYYLQQYPDVKKFNQPPIYHYLKIGWKLGYNPSKKFNNDAYLEANTDAMKTNPLLHYIINGKKERREIYAVTEQQCPITTDIISEIKAIRKNKKTILLFSQELALTGAPRALFNMAVSLKKQGFYPVIMAWKSGDMEKEIKEQGILCLVDTNLYSRLKKQDSLLKEFFSQFDAILFNTLVSLHLFEYFPQVQAKKIAWLHEGCMGYDTYAKVLKLKKLFNELDMVYSVGKYSQSFANRYMTNMEKSQILLYGIEDMSSKVKENVTDNEPDKVKFILPGAVSVRKGHDILLQALDILPNDIKSKMVVYVVGPNRDKELHEKLEKKSQRNKNIKYIGSIPYEKMIKLYQETDVILCPSRDDPMPMVCTEGFILEKAVIVSENTGTAGFIENGKNGFLIPSADVKALADAMTYVVEHKEILPSIGKEARKIYEKYFTIQKFDESIREIFNDINSTAIYKKVG